MPASAPATLPAELDLAEAMRIMDVASTLRRERDLVEQQFNHEQTKALLREKLQATAQVTGESLTPEQLDAAINWYFDNLHEFREPEPSLARTLAHLYVRRGQVLAATALTLLLLLSGSWMLTSRASPFSPAGRAARAEAAAIRAREQAGAEADRRQREAAAAKARAEQAAYAAAEARRQTLASAAATIEREAGLIAALAPAEEIMAEVQRIQAQAAVLQEAEDADGLSRLAGELTQTRDQLDDEYTIEVVAGEKSRSAFERFYEDEQGKRLSGYYVIVQAKSPSGQVLRQRIRNDESGSDELVDTWAERVPKAVYERLKADKVSDGILNERKFAVKKPGELSPEVVMPGESGQPLARDAQITRW